ncbi:threonine/serine exporter ThrE family protein [Archangium sp. Cb G35]|uniref:threonine/serine ThrE exporter family protein n=1 Tax=Archangium sp. Cb G35 TaxID=1920190 RepID=UPI001E2AC444|nr:threonine/serine exporter family protein [Archangium sp. Cb G35]
MLPAEQLVVLQPPPPVPAVSFTLRLGQALHRYGTPAHQLEEQMRLVAQRLGLEARFFSTPTSIFASFGPPEALQTSLIRVVPGEMDLGRLARLDALADSVIRGELSPEEGADRVESILAEPPRHGSPLLLLCWALAAVGGARLFGGGPREMGVAALISLLIGGLDLWTRRQSSTMWVLEPVAAILSSALAVVAASLVGPLSVQIVTLAGLIVLLPGLSLTVALNELATRNLISGTSRLTGAALVFLELGFGVALGTRLAEWFPLPAKLGPVPDLPGWTEPLALVSMLFGVSVLFRARPQDWGWIGVAGTLAYVGSRLGSQVLGTQLGAFVGALIVGLVTNVLARVRNRPAVITLVPAIMLLVPGSIGFRSMESLLARDVLAGVDTAFSMLMVAVALVAGLLFANALVQPRKVL